MEIIEEVFEGENSRLDVFVSLVADISRSRAAQLLENGNVLLNGEAAKKNTKLKNGSCVKIILIV